MATFVLVHRTFNAGVIWWHVTQLLRAAGHDVLSPTLTLAGEPSHLPTRDVSSSSTHVEDIVNAVIHENARDIVLVGHSYDARVISMVADRIIDRLRRIVYIDADEADEADEAGMDARRYDIVHAANDGKDVVLSVVGVDPHSPFVEWVEREGWRTQSIGASHTAVLDQPQQVANAMLAELA